MEHPVNIRPIRTHEDHRAGFAEIEAWPPRRPIRHARARRGHPRLLRLGDAEGVGGRDKPGHDDVDGIRAGRREALLAALQCCGTPEGSGDRLDATIHKISEAWKIPADLLVQPYKIETAA
jgi:hypothetical protein